MSGMEKPALYLAIWEFYVRRGSEAAFERVYGPEGEWVKLFRKAAGFVRTELNRDQKNRQRYLTLDYWESEEAYARFREQHLAEYQAIDERCEEMTEAENALGTFRVCS